MARLRLFGPARDVAGGASFELPGAIVAEVLNAASTRFGPDFETVLRSSRIWVNGVDAQRDQPLNSDDELAILPPVSGG